MNTTKTIKINWKKLPSVTRKNKYFYRGKHPDGTFYTISQAFRTDLWEVTDDFRHAQFATYKTAKAAMQAVETV